MVVTLTMLVALVTVSGNQAAGYIATTPDEHEVVAVYGDLQKKPARDRAQAFTRLEHGMKAAVWRHHLLAELAQHTEFTNAQREVIDYALSLLTPELFGVKRSDPAWQQRVALRVLELETRAKDIFPPKVARELFAQLGPDEPATAESATPQSPSDIPTRGRPSKTMGDVIGSPCGCSTIQITVTRFSIMEAAGTATRVSAFRQAVAAGRS